MTTAASQLYKLKKTPNAPKLWSYMAAILEVTGMDKGKVFPLNKFLGNVRTHRESGRIVRASGGDQLTSAGVDYFRDRYSAGSPQHIERAEVETMIRGITSGVGADEWIKVV